MPRNPVHPKVKATAKISAVLLALDALVVALAGAIPSPAVLAILATLHTVLPALAGYIQSV